jgi:hypothetical protein
MRNMNSDETVSNGKSLIYQGIRYKVNKSLQEEIFVYKWSGKAFLNAERNILDNGSR